jgi:hypothetical protein
MTNARARFALLCVLAFAALAAAVPAQADAWTSYYDCYMKPSGLWCDGRANGSFDGLADYDYNEGWYPGAWDGTVTACQRLYKPSTGTEMSGATCALNYTAKYYGVITCTCWEANVKQISGGNHSINGMADTDW